jgi:hypothetical protein
MFRRRYWLLPALALMLLFSLGLNACGEAGKTVSVVLQADGKAVSATKAVFTNGSEGPTVPTGVKESREISAGGDQYIVSVVDVDGNTYYFVQREVKTVFASTSSTYTVTTYSYMSAVEAELKAKIDSTFNRVAGSEIKLITLG